MNKWTKQQNKRRYNLHYKARKQGVKLNARRRVVYIPHNTTELNKYILILRSEFDYVVQTEII